MELFPSKAIRAFDKPVTVTYSRDTGSFCISGYVTGQAVCLVLGVGATTKDTSEAVMLSSAHISVGEMSDALTNTYALDKCYSRYETAPFFQSISAGAALYEIDEASALISNTSLGDVILEYAAAMHTFTSRDVTRENLRHTNMAVTRTTIDLVATDGYRLHIVGIPDGAERLREGEELNIALPTALLATLNLNSCLLCHISPEGSGTLTAMSKEYGMVSVLWDNHKDPYVPWKGVIPDVSESKPESERNYIEVPHAIPEFAKLKKVARRDNNPLYMLLHGDQYSDTFAVLDQDGNLRHVGGSEVALSETVPFLKLNAKCAYELGDLLKKRSSEDIALFIDEESSTNPVRLDWQDGDLSITHVLVPLRNTDAGWTPSDWE
jgi:hypothetical protein